MNKSCHILDKLKVLRTIIKRQVIPKSELNEISLQNKVVINNIDLKNLWSIENAKKENNVALIFH